MNIQTTYPEFNAGTTSADATGTVTVKASDSDNNFKITDLVISPNADMWVKLQNSDGDELLPQLHLPGTSVYSKSFDTPISVGKGKGVTVVSSTSGTVSTFITGYTV